MDVEQANRDLLKNLTSIVRTAIAMDAENDISFREHKKDTLRGLVLNENFSKEKSAHVLLFVDGACRGNPGPSAAAAVLISATTGHLLSRVCKHIGTATNNRAEFIAAANGLEKAVALGSKRVDLFSDSELLIDVLNGRGRVRDEHLAQQVDRIRTCVGTFEQCSATKIHRDQNFIADLLANLVLDLRA